MSFMIICLGVFHFKRDSLLSLWKSKISTYVWTEHKISNKNKEVYRGVFIIVDSFETPLNEWRSQIKL